MKRCKDCGVTHNDKNKLCDGCSEKARETVRRRKNKLVEQGLCISCGKNPNTSGTLRCAPCADKNKNKSAKRASKYLAEGKCIKCGQDKRAIGAWHHVWCAYCQLKYKFAYDGSPNNATDLINSLLQDQDYKCALTGRDLRTNKFHIDHIIPKSRGGTNDPQNLQLIVDEANVFKTNLSMEQIIKLAIDIAAIHGE